MDLEPPVQLWKSFQRLWGAVELGEGWEKGAGEPKTWKSRGEVCDCLGILVLGRGKRGGKRGL